MYYTFLALSLPGMEWVLNKVKDAILYVLNLFLDWVASIGQWVLARLVDGLVAVVPAWDASGVQGYLDMANYLFPLEEAVGLLMVWFSVWLLAWVYRAVKSWVPTVSG